ncbi:MAG: AAA family ATPase [Gammaproteobacteria bacterium]|nr:AAA family ATPase [Gammaproteobacteria bacterium]
MYNKYFGLTEEPFSIAANPRFLYMSARHREALAHLLYGIRSDSGFVLLSGEVGTGKTTVCRCLLEQLPEDTEVAFILNPKVSVIEMLGSICDELHIAYSKLDCSVKTLVDAINRHLLQRHADGRKTVVIIDEAQNLSLDVLEQLRLLTNLETNERKLMRIILLGQPELETMLSRPELKQVQQRITARYHLLPLDRSEVGAYVSHRLAVAGRQKMVFPARIFSRLYDKTGGVPRLINVICDRAMLGAYVRSQPRVNSSTLNKAAREVMGRSSPRRWLSPGAIMASLLLISVATTAALLYDQEQSMPVTTMLSQESVEAAPPPEATVEVPVLEVPGWPEQVIAEDNSLATAQIAQFKQWGIELENDDIAPCKTALKRGLRCYSGVGNLGSVANYDRPAILTLFNDKGQKYQATLLSIDNDKATLAFRHGIETVAIRYLEARWQGQYQLLWRTPPDGRSVVRPGDQGENIIWLTKSLFAAGIKSVKIHTRYSEKVTSAVKEFQRKSGLEIDGIAGRQTLIQLNSSTDDSIPRLSNRGES